MTVCKFYLKGCCRFGRNCRFEHPGEEQEDSFHSSRHQSTSVSNFSFKSALNEVVGGSGSSYNFQHHNQYTTNQYNSRAPSNNSSLNQFSFAQALEDNSFNTNNNNLRGQDSQMLDGFSFATAIQQVNNHQSNQFPNQLQQHHTTFGSFSSAQSPFGFSATFNQQQHHQLGFAQPSGSFHQPYHPSSFGHQQQHSSGFGSSFQQAPVASTFLPAQHSSQQPQPPNSTITQPQQQDNLDPNFTDPQQLSQAELDAYKSDKFHFRGIPIRPPPKLLC